MKKRSNGFFGCVAVAMLVLICSSLSFAQEFVHPGMLANDYDFARIRSKINAHEEPWTGAWNNLYNSWHSSPTYNIRGPADTICRGKNGQHVENYQMMYEDAASAYANALRWKISGEEGCAKKAVDILNRYANGLKCIGGTTDALLLTGLQGYQFANAAEIMRTYPGWSAGELKAFQDLMINVFYGLPSNPNYNGLRRFLAAHNGTQDRYYWANWDICAMTAMLAIGILCDNRDIYNEAINYYKSGKGNGNIANAVNPVYDGGLGQWQESGRDQGHTSMGPPLMAIFCEMAWKQGDDLYGFDDNRLLKGAEYVAMFNAGNVPPYTPYDHPKNFSGTETMWGLSWASRGAKRTGWDLLYNHYVVRKGLHAPFTQICALSLRPDGGPNDGNSGEFDLIGYSTLTSYLDPGFKKKNQVINWNDTTMTLGGPDLDLGAKGTSGLPCYYTLSDYSMGEIINNKVRAYKAGTLTVTAWQTGNEEYNEAPASSKWVIIKDSTIAHNSATLADGLTIQLQVKSTSQCVHVLNNDLRPGIKIVQYSCQTWDNQKWVLGQIGPDEYKLTSVHGGLVMDVTDKGNTAGSLVEQDTFTNEAHQIWKLLKNDDGTIRLINKGNNLALGVLNSDTAQLANFAMAPYTGSAAQKFDYIDVSKNLFNNQTIQLQVKSTSQCVHVLNNDLRPGTKVVQYACQTWDNQKWTLGQMGPDEYKLASVHGGQVLDVTDKGNTTGSLVEQDTFTNEAHQIWKLLKNDDGTIRLINKGNNLALGVLNSDTAQLANFAMAPYTGSAAQKFDFTDVSKSLLNNQTISFAPLPDIYPGDPDIVLTAKSSSGLPIIYTLSNPTVATVTNGVLHVLKGGTTAIIASQPGNIYFNAAFDVTQWLNTKKKQTLTVRDLSSFKLGDASIILGASASSGLPLSITSTDTTVAKYISIDDSLILGVIGSSLITFTQQGDETYLPFFSEQVLSIGKAVPEPTRSLEPIKNPEQYLSIFSDGHFMMATGFGSDRAVQVRLFDITGQEHLMQKVWTGKMLRLDLQSLQAGQYFLQIQHDGNISVIKVKIP